MRGSVQLPAGARWWEVLIEWGTVFLVVFAPLAFGAVETWAWSILVAGCLVLAVAERCHRRSLPEASGSGPPRQLARYILLAFGILFVFEPLLQLVPLPAFWIDALRPSQSLGGRSAVLTAWEVGRSWETISLYPALTASEAVKLAAYALLFGTLVNYRPASGSRQAFVTRLSTAVIVTGFAVSVIGILQKYSWQGKIYGLRSIRFGTPFGPFVNRNHFAGFIIMVIPLALGMLLSHPARWSVGEGNGFKDRLARSDPRRLLLAFMIFLMAVALLLSLSRGGIAAGLIGVVFFIVLARRYRLLSARKAGMVLAGAIILLAAVLVYFGPGPLVQRFEAAVAGKGDKDVRATLWGDTVRIYRDFPVLGTGLGTFPRIYPHYKSFIWKIPYTHAENDYLQAAAELGAWGWVSLAGFFLAFFWLVLAWKPGRREGAVPDSGHPPSGGWKISRRALVAGGSAGVLALLLQSAVSFNFSIPANALLLVVLLALTAGRVSRR